MAYFGIFGLEFEKSILMFDIRTFEFVKNQSFMIEKNFFLKLKLPNLGIFGLKFEKNYCWI